MRKFVQLFLLTILCAIVTSACKPAVTATPTRHPPAMPTPSADGSWTRPTDGMVMVHVPAGEFEMGSQDEEADLALQTCREYRGNSCGEDWFEDELPVHTVALNGFWVDRTEVTNAQYRQCVEAGTCDKPGCWNEGDFNNPDQPVVCVNWSMARNYCEWAGGQLPTEAEWEYAARGPEGKEYPWGNEFDGTRLNYCDANCDQNWVDDSFDDGYAYTAPVGSYLAGASWCGALDMAGNVWEWVADWHASYFPGREVNPSGPSFGTHRVLRGGAWRYDRSRLRSAERSWDPPDFSQPYIGFRCIVPLPEAVPPSVSTAMSESTAVPIPSALAPTRIAPQLSDIPWDDRAVFREGLIQAEQQVLDHLPGASVYHINLQISDDLLLLHGQEEVHYTNRESEPLTEIYFRLFPNAAGGKATVSEIKVNDQDVKPVYEFEDSAVRVLLPGALQPGEHLIIQMDFEVEVAQDMEGNYGLFGYFDNVLALDEFYPVIPVYDETAGPGPAGGWNVEVPPPNADTSYFDASFYLVRVTAPAGLTVIASGVEIGREYETDTQTLTFAAGPARDFYLAASDRYVVFSEMVGETTVNSYALAGREEGAQLALQFAISALESFNARFGPYPYTEFDVASTPMLALGIEYPGIVGITLMSYDPNAIVAGLPSQARLEGTVAHEAGHQWFYNIVGNDQVDEPWLDEAITQYITGLYYLDAHGEQAAQDNRDSWYARWERVGRADIPIGMPAAAYRSGGEYGAIVYGRGPLFVEALSEEMGQKTFDEFMRAYYQTHKWGIGTGDAFKQLAEQHCQCDLTALFEEWVYATEAALTRGSTTRPTRVPVPTRSPDRTLLVQVPAGEFEMGSEGEEARRALQACKEYRDACTLDWFTDELPVHTVALNEFWIGRTEVTNAQYRECVEAGGCDEPACWGEDDFNGPDQPVVCVTWFQAQDYCKWAGGRLPTEAEWEYAARGPEGKRYPWSDEFDGTRLNYCDANCVQDWADDSYDDGYAYTAPVGSYPAGASWCGAMDMAGNVFEWIQDWHAEYPSKQQANPIGPSTGANRVLRGGAWRYDSSRNRGAERSWDPPEFSVPYVGVRCVFTSVAH